ncbi:hypothetical protein EJ110_NYTH52752 [Nymphaea thermarum]|nr:hypothetical protein EJ110_NYTH52752 [Nymphaea thermarum]
MRVSTLYWVGTRSGYGPGPMGMDTEAGSSQRVWDLFYDRVFSPLLVFLLTADVIFSTAVSPCAVVACSSVVVAITANDSPPPSSPSKVFPPPPVILPPLPPLVYQEMTPKIDVAIDTGSNTKSENLPIQVTSIRLNKDNYLSWFAALKIGITSRGRLSYITGEKPAPSKTDPRWATWALEDSQVKVWIISSVSADIQPLILRKATAYDMWTVLARMCGSLKTKWEELDYHVNDDSHCGSDHALYWEKEWMDQTFIFLGGLRDEFESIWSQILNCNEIPGIEEVYARVESEEQRRQVMHIDSRHGSSPSAFVSCASGTGQRPIRRCSHCNKLGHSVDFCWDIHPEKRLFRGRPPSSRPGSFVPDSSQETVRGDSDSHVGRNSVDDQPRTCDHLFGHVYIRKKTDVVEDVDVTNPNPVGSPDDLSPIDEELPIALRKGTRFLFAADIEGSVNKWKLFIFLYLGVKIKS